MLEGLRNLQQMQLGLSRSCLSAGLEPWQPLLPCRHLGRGRGAAPSLSYGHIQTHLALPSTARRARPLECSWRSLLLFFYFK